MRSAFIYTLTVALALCLALVCLLFSGLTQGERLATRALKHLDAPYILGARGPEKYDCSGLVIDCAAAEGLGELPHAAKELYDCGAAIPLSALLPGDMLCFDTVRDGDPSDHVGFYIGGNCFVHASSAKRKVVVSALEDYYSEHCTGARRLACAYIG